VSQTLGYVRALVEQGDVRVSDHGYDELAVDGLFVREYIASIADAKVVEDYPDYGKGPCVLVLQTDREGRSIHVLWRIPKGRSSPAVLVTAYRPDSDRWDADLLRRKT